MKSLCAVVMLLAATGLTCPSRGFGEAGPVAQIPSLVSALKIEAPLDFCQEPVPLEEQDIRERFEKELLLSLWNRAQVLLWLKRSRRYLAVIEKRLQEAGLPPDLKYVAVAESGLLEHARSSKGAVGMWQFMAATGKKYGLIINRQFDQRRDFLASTGAAVRYFRNLYALFGSWTLSAAAFNMGEKGLSAAIEAQGTHNYYELYLPRQTQRFLFRILSAKVILSDPETFGFHLADEDFYPPILFDEIRVALRQPVPLRLIATASGTHFKRIRDLNPALRTPYLPGGNHVLRLPRGAAEGFQARLRAACKAHLAGKGRELYVVRKGDNLSAIAARFRVPLAALVLWNRLDPRKPIHPGQHLFIYSR